MSTSKLLMGSTMVVDLTKLFDVLDQVYLQNASVTVSLVDEDEAVVDGAEDLAFEQVEGTTGADTIYRTSIPHSIVLVKDARYTVRVTATSPDDASVREFNKVVTAVRG